MGLRHCAELAALLSLALLATGCSMMGSSTVAPSAASPDSDPPSRTASLRAQFTNLFSGSSANAPQGATGGAANIDCPVIDIRQGASTLRIGPADDKNAAMTLKYEGTFVRAARDCAVVAGQLVMNIGVQGRIILGPAGGPGQVDVPLRIAVVDERPTGSKTITTKLIHIPVTVQSAEQNPDFTHIEHGLSFPLPSAADLDHYIVYIGFDALAAAPAQKHEKPKPKRKPTAKSGGSTG